MAPIKSSQGVILIVDDEAELRELLRDILLKLTPNILTAENGQIALEIIKSTEVHAVLSDLAMPVLGGFDLLREVRKLALEVPFVFATGFGDSANLLEALRLGAVDFIEKPFAMKTISEVMEKVLELGVALKAAEDELDALTFDTRFSADDLIRLKNMRRAALMMKLECDVYTRRKIK